jgi:hypothetical protein
MPHALRAQRFAFVLAGLAAAAAAQQQQQLLDAPVMTPWAEEFELLGDIDHDGDIDVLGFLALGISSVKTQFTPYFNDGLGNLAPGVTVALPVDAGSHVLWVDVDGDTYLDLLVSNFNSSGPAGLRIYPGLPGGLFAAPIQRLLPGNVIQLGSGNANSDAFTDIYLQYFNGTDFVMQWLAGDPTRTFPAGPTLPLTFDYRAGFVVRDLDAPPTRWTSTGRPG